MPVMSKAQAKKRLKEARNKLRAVNYSHTKSGDVHLSQPDSQKLFKMDAEIEKLIKKLS